LGSKQYHSIDVHEQRHMDSHPPDYVFELCDFCLQRGIHLESSIVRHGHKTGQTHQQGVSRKPRFGIDNSNIEY
jgi:hypothetical protein